MDEDSPDELAVARALDEAEASDRPADAVAPVLDGYRDRIERMLRLRMDPRVVGRVGVSDVMQEALVEVTRRLPSYLEARRSEPKKRMPFFLWVRFLAGQSLRQAHRHHLGTLARDVSREVAMDSIGSPSGGMPEATPRLLASALVASGVSPASAAAADEQREILADALDSLSPEDREVLFLRHFDQLSTREIAKVLSLSPSGAGLRHLRALAELQRSLTGLGVTFDADSLGG